VTLRKTATVYKASYPYFQTPARVIM